MIKEKLGKGEVNDTYLVKSEDGTPAYVLQRINTVAFRNPQKLMDNILKVTSYIKSCGGETVNFIPFPDGQYIREDFEGTWRMMEYIPSYSTDSTEDSTLIEGAAHAFGDFLQNIQGFDEDLYETIPQFHNTEKRIEDCLNAAEINFENRSDNALKLIHAIEQRKNEIINNYHTLLSSGPTRITHNDTKISNVLFDKDTHKPICIVDLDTVMMGMTLYDFGDAARSLVHKKTSGGLSFNESIYEFFENAYLSKTKDILTKDERANLRLATQTISIELGTRYLEDYLSGNKYFNFRDPKETLRKADALLTCTLKLY